MSKEKIVTIKWNGEDVKVVLKKLTCGEFKKIWREVIGDKVKFTGEMPEFEIDFLKVTELVTMYSIKEAPFEPTIENLEKLDYDEYDKLSREALELNPFLGRVRTS